jgi:hypothetical protein
MLGKIPCYSVLVLGITLSIFTAFLLFGHIIFAISFIIMTAIYAFGIYFINFDKDFLAFFKYQIKNEIDEL